MICKYFAQAIHYAYALSFRPSPISMQYVPSVNALFNTFATEPVATACDTGLFNTGHTNGTLKVFVEYLNL